MKKLIAENPEFCKVDKDTARVAGTLLGVEMAMEKIIEAEGEEVNMCTGLKEWLLEEREEGHKEGHKEGRKEGHKEGRSVLNVLNIKLAEAGRVDDILKAAMDNEYQDKLLAEYGLMS